MNKLALSTFALGLTLAAPSAFAQQACPPGSWLCADITIGGGVVAPPPVVAPAPYYQPPPPVVVVPPRPRVYLVPPPPARVYVAPPPVVVYQPAPVYQQQPQVVYYQQQQQTRYVIPPPRRGYVGLQLGVGGSYIGNGSAMGGINGGLRFRGQGHFGGELTVGAYGGRDFNGDARTEVPVALNGLIYFNPQNRFQVYTVLGIGAGWAHVDYRHDSSVDNRTAHGGRENGDYGYIGGTLGLGAELQLSPRFSLFADVRGFIRTRIDEGARGTGANSNPEFTRTNAMGVSESTNTSVGLVGQLGAALYF
jgi:hypothetical protein